MKNEAMGYLRRERKLAVLYILPALSVFILFMFYPLVYTVYLSFFRWNMVSPKMMLASG